MWIVTIVVPQFVGDTKGKLRAIGPFASPKIALTFMANNDNGTAKLMQLENPDTVNLWDEPK